MENNFFTVTEDISRLVYKWEGILVELENYHFSKMRNKQNRTVIEIVGHLVDSASNNHQRIVRLQYNTLLDFPDYRQHNDLWIAIQDYQHADWNNLIQLWKFYNLHIVHLIESVDVTKLDNCWCDFEDTQVTLKEMIAGYLSHLELHLNEIDELISQK